MTSCSIGFCKGDQVIIRFGERRGQKGEIVDCQPARVYKVMAEDGSFLFFSGNGLQPETEEVLSGKCNHSEVTQITLR